MEEGRGGDGDGECGEEGEGRDGDGECREERRVEDKSQIS
jgi:hypothetical protein